MSKNREQKELELLRAHSLLKETGGTVMVLSLVGVPSTVQTLFRGKVLLSKGQVLVVKKAYLPEALRQHMKGTVALAFASHEHQEGMLQAIADSGLTALGAIVDGQVLSKEHAEMLLPPPSVKEQEDSGESDRLDVTLEDVTNKLAVIRVLRADLGMPLLEAKKTVDSAPVQVADGVDSEVGGSLAERLTEAGAKVSVRKTLDK